MTARLTISGAWVDKAWPRMHDSPVCVVRVRAELPKRYVVVTQPQTGVYLPVSSHHTLQEAQHQARSVLDCIDMLDEETDIVALFPQKEVFV